MFKRFLEAYVEVCNNIVTEAANNVLMFEAGEQAALNYKTQKIDDIKVEFAKAGVTISVEIHEKEIIFHVEGMPLSGKKCMYCEILRGFFSGLSKKHFDPRFYCKKSGECILEGANECIFIAEMVE